MRKKRKWHKRQKRGRGGRNIASVSFRQIPRTTAGARDMCAETGRWKVGNYEGKRANRGPIWQKLSDVGEILPPSASANVRRRPWESATCVGG